ncbi:MAG TPA: SDR family oxidoreductase [Acidimicrobiales bacterium]|nr:SDR family oxidoreductase [Acidimicrobiales bacterium]
MSDDDQTFPVQEQEYPGTTDAMDPRPADEMAGYTGRGLLEGKRALVTGGDSGIGKATAIAFAKEGADVAIAYLSEDDDARQTAKLIEKEGRRALLLPGDLSVEDQCSEVVRRTVEELGGIDIVVNNIAYQNPVESLAEITTEQWDRTFRTNIYSYFWVTKAALEHMPDGGAIVNSGSINGLRGNKSLIDYSATKGAILAFTYSMAQSLVERRIRVNCVAPGPVWTPLIPATMGGEKAARFGQQTPMNEAAQPDEIAPSYVFFAAEQLSSYYSGEVLAPIGGETLPG